MELELEFRLNQHFFFPSIKKCMCWINQTNKQTNEHTLIKRIQLWNVIWKTAADTHIHRRIQYSRKQMPALHAMPFTGPLQEIGK